MKLRRATGITCLFAIMCGCVTGRPSNKNPGEISHAMAERYEVLTLNIAQPLPRLPFYVATEFWCFEGFCQKNIYSSRPGRMPFQGGYLWYCDSSGQCQSPPPAGH